MPHNLKLKQEVSKLSICSSLALASINCNCLSSIHLNDFTK